jgi:sortase A
VKVVRHLLVASAATVVVVASACAPAATGESSDDAVETSPSAARLSADAEPGGGAGPGPGDVGRAESPRTSDGRPRRAELTVPRLGLRDLVVVPYVGWTDDAPGTTIQDRGVAASPHGPRGGVGPGGVGNYQVTAHRLSSTRAFEFLPRLQRGDEVLVETRRWRFVYRVVETRRTSFRSPQSLREQRAAVPGRPGRPATRAMITLSTCATVEDHAAGNYWADRFDNPEHRIDKIGVLVEARRR